MKLNMLFYSILGFYFAIVFFFGCQFSESGLRKFSFFKRQRDNAAKRIFEVQRKTTNVVYSFKDF
jgi:hypothetical protein